VPATAGTTEPLLFVLSIAFVIEEIAKLVDVAFWSPVFPATVSAPWSTLLPVVVAPPEIVRPLACVPPPMVEEAFAIRPAVN